MKFLKILTNAFLALVLLSAVGSPKQTQAAATALNDNLASLPQCLAYEPEVSALRGQLLRKNMINATNQKETIWVLKLDRPACVDADGENEMNVKVDRITDVQLVLQAEQLKKYRLLVNKKVEARGTLFGGHTQHHFTDVLMIVEEIKAR